MSEAIGWLITDHIEGDFLGGHDGEEGNSRFAWLEQNIAMLTEMLTQLLARNT